MPKVGRLPASVPDGNVLKASSALKNSSNVGTLRGNVLRISSMLMSTSLLQTRIQKNFLMGTSIEESECFKFVYMYTLHL